MKNKLLILLISVLVFTVTGCGCENKTNNNDDISQEQTNNVEDKTIEEQVKNETQENQEDITFSDIKIREFGASNIVSGKIKNNRSETRNVELTLKMYNSSTSRLLGKVKTEVKDLKASEERIFEISIMGDYTTVDKFEVEVKDI